MLETENSPQLEEDVHPSPEPSAVKAEESSLMQEGDEEIREVDRASDVYKLGKTLGRGAFGKVYEAVFRPTGETIAVKVSKRDCLRINLIWSPLCVRAMSGAEEHEELEA